jgi:predicted dithiol-disulfide oxidoreductase (DUF899 family)
MEYRDASEKLSGYRKQIAEIREKMRAVQASAEPQAVQDYELATTNGPVRLSALFGHKDDLIVIHNMGASCPYCTLWADGYSGIYPHLASRAAFVVASPDPPASQQKFAAGRGWRFPMVSHHGSSFAADMGYRSESGGWRPGVSVFRRDGGRILRVADTGFDVGDDFCALWHLFYLLPGGAGGWTPKFSYV